MAMQGVVRAVLVGLALLCAPAIGWAQQQLPPASALTGNEQIPCVQPPPGSAGAANKACTPNLLSTFISSHLAAAGSPPQIQVNIGGVFSTVTGLSAGLDSTHQGLFISATNPNAASSGSDVTLARFQATMSALSSTVGFTDVNGPEDYITTSFGYNALATGPPAVVAKTTFLAHSVVVNGNGDGQTFGFASTVTCNGGGSDCELYGGQLFSGGVPINGNEGNLSAFVNRQQSAAYTTGTINSVIAPTATGSTTITSGLTGSNVDQTFAVGSTTGFHTGDWVRINEQAPNNQDTVQATKIDAVGSGTLTAIVYYSTPAGATVLPAQILQMNVGVGPGTGWGQDRVAICTTCAAITAGTAVLSGDGFTVVGTATNFTNGMVNGDSLNPGVFLFDADTFTGGPSGTTFHSEYQISSVTNTTHLALYKTDVAGNSAVTTKCVAACTYKVLPGAMMLFMGDGTRLPSNQVVMDGPPAMWTGQAGQTIEQRIGPFIDAGGPQEGIGGFTIGGTYRFGHLIRNIGTRAFNAGLLIDTAGYIGQAGSDVDAWTVGVNIQSAVTGIQIIGGAGSTGGVFAQSLTGNGFGFEASNVTGGNGAHGLDLSGFGTGIALDNAPKLLTVGGALVWSGTAPTISSGFGTGAAIAISNGTLSFLIGVGTSNTGAGVVGLPTARTGWVCAVTDVSATSANVFVTKQTAYSTTSCSVQNYTTAAATHAWVDNDVLAITATAF